MILKDRPGPEILLPTQAVPESATVSHNLSSACTLLFCLSKCVPWHLANPPERDTAFSLQHENEVHKQTALLGKPGKTDWLWWHIYAPETDLAMSLLCRTGYYPTYRLTVVFYLVSLILIRNRQCSDVFLLVVGMVVIFPASQETGVLTWGWQRVCTVLINNISPNFNPSLKQNQVRMHHALNTNMKLEKV